MAVASVKKRGAMWWWGWVISPIVGGILIAGGCAMGEPHDDSPNQQPQGPIHVTCANGSDRNDCKLSK